MAKKVKELLASLLKEPEEDKPSFGFGWVFVFPLPEVTTEEEEEAFKKKFVTSSGFTHEELLRHSIIVHDDFRQSQQCSIKCADSLKSLRCAVIEMFESFLHSVLDSHDGGSGESKVFKFTSVDTDELFICVKMSDAVAEILADHGEYHLQVDSKAFSKIGIALPDDGEVVPAYIKFDSFMKDAGFLKQFPKPEAPEKLGLLRQVDRVRIFYDKITDFISLPELYRLGLLLHAYPAHNSVTLKKLKRRWGNLRLVCTTMQPLEDVRDYFGESVAFYFLFVQQLGWMQFLFGIVFVPLGLAYMKAPQYKPQLQLAYSFCLICWYFCALKHWRRVQTKYANRWGMDLNSAEMAIRPPINPAFHGEMRPSPYNSNEVFEQPNESKAFRGRMTSYVVTGLFMCLIICSVGANQYFAGKLDAKHPGGWVSKVAALGLSVQIKVFDYLWGMIAEKLTDMEQHPTLIESDQSKASKIFIMKFINTFYAFFYTAFFQAYLDPDSCGPLGAASCPDLLVSNVIIVYVTYISFGVMGMLTPLISFKLEVWKEARAMRKKGLDPDSLSLLEQQAKMLEYTGQDQSDDYLEIIFPIAFILMFSSMVPLITNVLAIVQTFTQIRTDAWKLCSAYRRVFPNMVDGIGVWSKVMEAFVPLCVVMNLLLLLTQFKKQDFLSLLPYAYVVESYEAAPILFKAFLFLLGFQVCMIANQLINAFIPDESARVLLSKKRQEKQRLRIFQYSEIALADEKKETILMKSHGDAVKAGFEKVPALKPGDPMYVKPLV